MADKTALITGSSRGIGRGIALGLAEQGWKVAVNYRSDEEAARDTLAGVRAAGGEGMVIQADISLSSDRQRLVEAVYADFTRLDLLVNNAGIAPAERLDLLDLTEEGYDRLMAVNLKGTLFLTQLVARQMLSSVQEDGSPSPMIINIINFRIYQQHQPGGVLYIQSGDGDGDGAFR